MVFPALVLVVQVGNRRRWPALLRGEHNDVVGFVVAVVGGIYAVLLAFVVIVAWESSTGAEEVVEASWPAMADGRPGDPEAEDVLQEMADVLAGTPVTTPGEQEFVGAEVDRLNELVSLRSQRLDFVERGIPASLWIALVVGALVTVGLALLFGLERTALHLVMVGSLAVLIGVLLFVAVGFNVPFAGDVAVHPTAFERVLDDFGARRTATRSPCAPDRGDRRPQRLAVTAVSAAPGGPIRSGGCGCRPASRS
ncbi:bestrophin-like domain [Geodermatophilus sp. SYSU D00684]